MRNVFQVALLGGLLCWGAGTVQAAELVRVYAAGSTRNAFTEAARAFTAKEGIAVQPTFGASGLLLGRLRGGEAADLYAPADLRDAQALHDAGLSAPVVRIARSRLCVVTRAGLAVTPDTMLDVIRDPGVKILAPAPEVDATGVYVWALYKRAEEVRPGSYRLLDDKTVRLDAKTIDMVPPGRNGLAFFFEKNLADLFFSYCNSAAQAVREAPILKVTEIPPQLAVPVQYGVTLLDHGNRASGRKFIDFLISPEGQAILAKWGFTAP